MGNDGTAVDELTRKHKEIQVKLTTAYRQLVVRDTAQQFSLQRIDAIARLIGMQHDIAQIQLTVFPGRDLLKVLRQILQLVLELALVNSVAVSDVIGRKFGQRLQRTTDFSHIGRNAVIAVASVEVLVGGLEA